TPLARAGVCGLENSGNSCYLNAVLQCLCSTVPLVEHLLHPDTEAELARFGCRGKNQVKLRTNVLFSMKLSLSSFLSGPEQNSSCSSYSLYAVVNHTGNLNMGHYTALCLSTVTGTWHHFDDAAVREVQDESVQSSSAYMLLYSRKPVQKPNIHGLSL
ncbi:unnamed protein product, partial [Tetraodon nigroviridis]